MVSFSLGLALEHQASYVELVLVAGPGSVITSLL